MLNLLKPKKDKSLMRLNQHLHFAFSKLDKDISHVQMWIHHLKEKDQHMEKSHNDHVELTQKDLSSINKWIHFLNNHNLELQKYLKELTTHILGLRERDEALSNRVNELESKLKELSISHGSLKDAHKGQLRTSQGTSKGHEEDMSPEKTPSETQGDASVGHVISKEDIKVVEPSVTTNKSSLTGSQLELLRVLYESDRPLSYGDLAKVLGKKSKSIRNLIYEIRERGIPVESRFVGLRKKGFYLTKESKIKLSGR